MYDERGAQRERVSKDSLIVEALGAIDELNSFLGIAKTQSNDTKIQKIIGEVQKNLLTIGSITGGSKLRFTKNKTKKLERIIDEIEGKLPILKNFVVPGGSLTAAWLQYARALTRRAERRIVALSNTQITKPSILIYMNRLSDFLFMLAREVNNKSGIKDETWVGRKR